LYILQKEVQEESHFHEEIVHDELAMMQAGPLHGFMCNPKEGKKGN